MGAELKTCLVIANLVHASPRIPGLLAFAPLFGWKASVITPGHVSSNVRQGMPLSFLAESTIIEVAGFGDVFAWLRPILRPMLRDSEIEASSVTQAMKRRYRSGRLHDLIDRGRHVAHVVSIPDTELPWIRPLTRAGRSVISEQQIDVLVSSSPHPSVHFAAKRLAREARIPWVADLRDPWSQNHNYPYGRSRRAVDRFLEVGTLSKATELITVNESCARHLASLHERPVHVVLNGYTSAAAHPGPAACAKKLLIAYTGTIYERRQNPRLFLDALSQVLRADPTAAKDLQVLFVGDRSASLEPAVVEAGLGSVVEFLPQVSIEEAVAIQCRAHVLLQLDWVHSDADSPEPHSTKLFEYLGARRPILLVGSPQTSDVGRIIEQTQAGVHVGTVGDATRAIASFLAEFRASGAVSYNGREDVLERYSYRTQSKRFCEILDQAVASHA